MAGIESCRAEHVLPKNILEKATTLPCQDDFTQETENYRSDNAARTEKEEKYCQVHDEPTLAQLEKSFECQDVAVGINEALLDFAPIESDRIDFDTIMRALHGVRDYLAVNASQDSLLALIDKHMAALSAQDVGAQEIYDLYQDIFTAGYFFNPIKTAGEDILIPLKEHVYFDESRDGLSLLFSPDELKKARIAYARSNSVQESGKASLGVGVIFDDMVRSVQWEKMRQTLPHPDDSSVACFLRAVANNEGAHSILINNYGFLTRPDLFKARGVYPLVGHYQLDQTHVHEFISDVASINTDPISEIARIIQNGLLYPARDERGNFVVNNLKKEHNNNYIYTNNFMFEQLQGFDSRKADIEAIFHEMIQAKMAFNKRVNSEGDSIVHEYNNLVAQNTKKILSLLTEEDIAHIQGAYLAQGREFLDQIKSGDH